MGIRNFEISILGATNSVDFLNKPFDFVIEGGKCHSEANVGSEGNSHRLYRDVALHWCTDLISGSFGKDWLKLRGVRFFTLLS